MTSRELIMELITSTAHQNVGDYENVSLYQKQEKVYSAHVSGKYERIRRWVSLPLIALFFLVPWLTYQGIPLVWFDLEKQQFHILNNTFWPQEFYLLIFILMIAAIGLFTLTAWSGRVWCGYSCPHTVWTDIFIRVERWLEGSRNRQIKRDQQAITLEKAVRKTLKHSIWLLIAFLTGFTFVAYFTPARELISLVNAWSWSGFWVLFFTLMTWLNAGFMREQVCKHMCPYARFQSAMLNSHSLVVTYDNKRGEPRNALKKSVSATSQSKGSCIDCWQCVHVCPVGIDIRNGLQMECINCGLCVDACNSVMKKIGSAPDLIRYSSDDDVEGKNTRQWNIRAVSYGIVFILLVGIFLTLLWTRIPLNLDVVRERGELFHSTDSGQIQNIYKLKITNREQRDRKYLISVDGMDAITVSGDTSIQLGAGELKEVVLRLGVNKDSLIRRFTTIRFMVNAVDDKTVRVFSESRFIGPREGSGN